MTTHNRILSPVVIVALLLSAVLSTIIPAIPASAQIANPIFPLEGTPGDYIKGTSENGGKGFHGDVKNITWGWDYWRPDKGPAVVLAAIDGTVVRCGNLDDVGNPVITIENSEWEVGYLHMERVDVACGSPVIAGTPIGLTGNIGRSDWNHLHFWAKSLVTSQFDESQNWPETSPQPPVTPAAQPQTAQRIATQDLSRIPVPTWIAFGLAAAFILGLANQKTRGPFALGILVVLVAGLGYMVINHRDEIRWPPRDPNIEVAQPTPASPPSDEPCEISPKYPAEIQQWCVLITGYAHLRGFDPNFIAAQILQESKGNPDAYSKSGAVGLMQVMPRDGIAAGFKNDQGEPYFANRPTIEQLKNPTFNVDFGTGMMEGLRNKFSEGYSEEQLRDPAIQRDILREALKKYGPIDRGYEYADIVLAIWDNYR